MITFITFLVFWILLPAFYLLIGIFNFLLFRTARTTELHFRSWGGILSGILLSAIVILLDQNVIKLFPTNPSQLDISFSSALLSLLIGCIFVLFLDFLLRKGVVPFFSLISVGFSVISAYAFYIELTSNSILAFNILCFLLGIFIWSIVDRNTLYKSLILAGDSSTDAPPPEDDEKKKRKK